MGIVAGGVGLAGGLSAAEGAGAGAGDAVVVAGARAGAGALSRSSGGMIEVARSMVMVWLVRRFGRRRGMGLAGLTGLGSRAGAGGGEGGEDGAAPASTEISTPILALGGGWFEVRHGR